MSEEGARHFPTSSPTPATPTYRAGHRWRGPQRPLHAGGAGLPARGAPRSADTAPSARGRGDRCSSAYTARPRRQGTRAGHPLAALSSPSSSSTSRGPLLVLLGVEQVRIVPGSRPRGPLDLVYMAFTHSLPAALLWGGRRPVSRGGASPGRPARVVARRRSGRSHWLSTFRPRPDLPRRGDRARSASDLGHRALALALELGLLAARARSWRRVPAARRTSSARRSLTVLQLASL